MVHLFLFLSNPQKVRETLKKNKLEEEEAEEEMDECESQRRSKIYESGNLPVSLAFALYLSIFHHNILCMI
jgi:hypothetical protein